MKCALPKLGSLFFGRKMTERQKVTTRLLSLSAAVFIVAGQQVRSIKTLDPGLLAGG